MTVLLSSPSFDISRHRTKGLGLPPTELSVSNSRFKPALIVVFLLFKSLEIAPFNDNDLKSNSEDPPPPTLAL